MLLVLSNLFPEVRAYLLFFTTFYCLRGKLAWIQYLHEVSKNMFLVTNANMGLCLYIPISLTKIDLFKLKLPIVISSSNGRVGFGKFHQMTIKYLYNQTPKGFLWWWELMLGTIIYRVWGVGRFHKFSFVVGWRHCEKLSF